MAIGTYKVVGADNSSNANKTASTTTTAAQNTAAKTAQNTAQTAQTANSKSTAQNNTSQTSSAYNPYYDVYSIVQNKGSYNDSRYVNGSSDYDKYRVAAEEYYNKLKSSGYSDVADELSNSSYEKALEILARYQPDSTSASTNISSNNVGDVAANYLSQIENYISPSTNTQNVLSSSAQKAEQLLNSYLSGVDSTNQQSQNYQDNIYKYINDQSGRYDSLNNYNLNTNPYSTETAKSILATYGVKGANASDDAIADSSGDNGGNIDSYAAANAKRQQLAFTTAGNEAVLSDFDSRVTRSLQILQSLGVDVGDALDKVGSNIDSQITQNANTLSGANTAMNTAVNGAVASDEVRTNAATQILSDLTSLAQSEISAASTKDGYVSQEKLAQIRADLQLKIKQMGVDSDIASSVADYVLQQFKNEGAIAVADTEGQYDYAVANRESTAKENVAGTNAYASMYNTDANNAQKASDTEIQEANKMTQYFASQNNGLTDSSNPTYAWIDSTLDDIIDSTPANAAFSSADSAYNDRVKRAANELLSDSVYGQFSDLVKAAMNKKLRSGSSSSSASASTASGTSGTSSGISKSGVTSSSGLVNNSLF